MSDFEAKPFSHLTDGKIKPWMWGAALGIAVLVYYYYKHSSAGTLASGTTATSTDTTGTYDPTAGTDTNAGADSSLGNATPGSAPTYNNYYITETTPKTSSTTSTQPKAKPKLVKIAGGMHGPAWLKAHGYTDVGGVIHGPKYNAAHSTTQHKTIKAHSEVMQSHPATHPMRRR